MNFGLAHLGIFAWVGGFSSAPNAESPAELVPDPAAAKQRLKLLWLACGNKAGLIRVSQGVQKTTSKRRASPTSGMSTRMLMTAPNGPIICVFAPNTSSSSREETPK